MYEDVAACRR
ncbi:hypothetical protein E2C01_099627 [Portunus trituberculatus]|uniref:Uncharacterized protein n=1 Tax=Portunus trituberculatus TaxID=210409 RepID=A0A5B7KHB3_PORTR|nr:hypothetical protein [Portunus trituberculatus]